MPFREDNLWGGYPEDTNASYGLAKKTLLVRAQACRQQYGFTVIYLLPVNLCGPRDNFDPANSHVIPALIKKCFDAIENNEDEAGVWGDGSHTRESLYVAHCAEAIVLATERYNKSDPVNIGAGFEISIKDSVYLITDLTGLKSRIIWDTGKPGGQPGRCLDLTHAEREFGFRAQTSFEKCLRRTIEWYRSHREQPGRDNDE